MQGTCPRLYRRKITTYMLSFCTTQYTCPPMGHCDYTVHNGTMTLFARSCAGKPGKTSEYCRVCQDLAKNEKLEGIMQQIKHGIHENAKFAYYGFSGLIELLHRKLKQINFYRFNLIGGSTYCSMLSVSPWVRRS